MKYTEEAAGKKEKTSLDREVGTCHHTQNKEVLSDSFFSPNIDLI